MKSNLRWLVLVVAVAGMGITLPSCPGQEEMKQKIDVLQNANNDLNKRVQTLMTQVNALNSDMTQVKQLLPQMTNVIQSQRTALDQMDAAVKDLQAKVAASAKGGKKRR